MNVEEFLEADQKYLGSYFVLKVKNVVVEKESHTPDRSWVVTRG